MKENIMCLYPKLIKNRKYIKNKKNKGIVPIASDDRLLYVPVGCGRCIECSKQKARNWQIRMTEEIRDDRSGKFVTLTFSNEALIELEKDVKLKNNKQIVENEIATLAVRRFLERWRKKYKISVKHWLVTELGHTGSERIHLHGILFTDIDNTTVQKLWKYGHIWVGDYVNEKTINYIVKYVNKIDLDHKGYISKVLCSAGLGKNYIKRNDSNKNKFNDKKTDTTYRTKLGLKLNLPIYYRNKLYTEEERQKLWLNMLDKNERWICGEKVAADNEIEYLSLLEHYRKLNKRLGYGDDSKEWNKEMYIQNVDKLKYIKKYMLERVSKEK